MTKSIVLLLNGTVYALTLAFLAMFPQWSYGQTCTNPPTQAATFAWSQGATVQVNISPSFSASQQSSIQSAFTNWQNASNNNSGVTFTFTSNATPISGTNTYQVSSQAPSCSTCQGETGGTTDGTSRLSAFTNVNPQVTNLTALTQMMAHEIGHTFALGDCTTCAAGTSVMTLASSINDTTSGRSGPSTCDVNTANQAGNYSASGGGGGGWDPTFCSDYLECATLGCCDPCSAPCSPVIINLNQGNIEFAPATEGVWFDIHGDGTQKLLSWTRKESSIAFLALDRNGNGLIDNGKELFGNFTSQPEAADRNGFLALAVYDSPQNGGNGDGLIDSSDNVFGSLRLWKDANHNGFSEPAEIYDLPSLGVLSISVQYQPSWKRDRHGNVFRYRAKVNGNDNPDFGPWAYDVLLTTVEFAGATSQNRKSPATRVASVKTVFCSTTRRGSLR